MQRKIGHIIIAVFNLAIFLLPNTSVFKIKTKMKKPCREQKLGNISQLDDGEKEDSKEPGESKEEHHTADAEHHMQDGSGADCFLLSNDSVPFVLNQHYNDPDKDEEVEEHYGEDGFVGLPTNGHNVSPSSYVEWLRSC